jgi:hypothetical protein
MAVEGEPMLAKLQTFSLVGIGALPVEVEVELSPGELPKTVLVGLPEAGGFVQSADHVEDAGRQRADFDFHLYWFSNSTATTRCAAGASSTALISETVRWTHASLPYTI